MTALRYPPATWKGGAVTYGPLPDHGMPTVALVLHTTETKGVPGFGDGKVAPHLVYDPRDRTWEQWAEFDRYVGTMVGHATGHYNCKSLQVEIVAYSDRALADQVGGVWVGDFTDAHYADLGALFAWCMDQGLVGDDVTETPDGGWLYGYGSHHRMSESGWLVFSGLTAHGAVPGNRHWDTGVLDLARIADNANGDPWPCIPGWWYDTPRYLEQYASEVWPGGLPDMCGTVTHWEMSVIYDRLRNR